MTTQPRNPHPAQLTDVEWEVLYLLYDALDQLRKLTLSFSEIRYLAVERTEDDLRQAVEGLLRAGDAGPGVTAPLIVPIPNLTNLPIYRITPAGRRLVAGQMGATGGSGTAGKAPPAR